MRILITGAAGLVGSALATAYAEEKVTALRHGDLDITLADRVRDAVETLRPDVIFNCSVIGVDACESDPLLAARVNVDGPRTLATAAQSVGALIVHFSTNYVFDGARTDTLPYTIDDEARPIQVYGRTKLEGERAVASAAERAILIRTSWVFGPGKESFLSSAGARLQRGDRIRAIVDTFASTTYVDDLVARARELVRLETYGTYHVVNDGVCSYETFARECARVTGVSDEDAARLIERVSEADMGRPAPRPRWTPMRCLLSERLGLAPLRPWEGALAAYLG
jgi:dTDP-4-dehydrorhamnose reductase